MKRIFIICFVMVPVVANAAEPSISCPTGYVRVLETAMSISNGACPVGTISVGTAETCLVSSPAGSCMMYAPAETEYTDETGTYKYTGACPLT